MKALELTVYPLRDKVGTNARPGYVVGKRGVSTAEVFRMGRAKQLTDAELAAEFWFMDAVVADQSARASHGDVKPIDVLMAQADLKTIKRLATLPHASETNYE